MVRRSQTVLRTQLEICSTRRDGWTANVDLTLCPVSATNSRYWQIAHVQDSRLDSRPPEKASTTGYRISGCPHLRELRGQTASGLPRFLTNFADHSEPNHLCCGPSKPENPEPTNPNRPAHVTNNQQFMQSDSNPGESPWGDMPVPP